MILNHLWGLCVHPKQEWNEIDGQNENVSSSLIHMLIMAFIPVLTGYYATAHIGWSIGVGDVVKLSEESALRISIAMYVALVLSVFTLSFLTHWMAITFGATPSYKQTIELTVYASTPVFISGLSALYPELWFLTIAGLIGVGYSVYLLYIGVPILMHIPEERGFIYASSIVTASLVLLVSIIILSILLWNFGFEPEFII